MYIWHVFVYLCMCGDLYMCVWKGKVLSTYQCVPAPGFKIKSFQCTMGWLRLVASSKLLVSFAKEPYDRDYILQKTSNFKESTNRSHPISGVKKPTGITDAPLICRKKKKTKHRTQFPVTLRDFHYQYRFLIISHQIPVAGWEVCVCVRDDGFIFLS